MSKPSTRECFFGMDVLKLINLAETLDKATLNYAPN